MIYNEGFLRFIGEHPDDDAVRLVYADWLEEHGDPEYAEFIRLQITLFQHADGKGELPPAVLARLHSRERALLSRNETQWLQPLRDLGARGRVYGEFSRGFVEDVVIDAAVFVERGQELFRVSPVANLHLKQVEPVARQLARCSHLAQVHRLAFEGSEAITASALRTLLESEHLAALKSLYLWSVPLSDADLLDLARMAVLPPLQCLTLSEAAITGAAVPELVKRFQRLEELSLSYNSTFVSDRFAEILAALPAATLRSLSFDQTRLGTLGMRALAEAKQFVALRELWLRGCGFDDNSMAAFARASHLTAVKKLYLGWDALGNEGGIALATWPGLHALQTLNLDGCGLPSDGAAALARALHSSSVVQLELRGNRIGDHGAQALAAGDFVKNLHTLDLSGNAITAVGIRPLAEAVAGNLRHLALDENQIGDQGANVLADSPQLRALRWLTLEGNGVSQEAARRLVAKLPNLTVFSGDGGFLTDEHLDALRDSLMAGGSAEAVNTAVETRLVQAVLDDPDDLKARELYARFLKDIQCPWWVVIYLQRPNVEEHALPEALERWRAWFAAGREDWLAPLLSWAQLFDDSESFDRGFLRRVHFVGALPDEVADTLAQFPPLALLPLEIQRGHMTGEGAFQVLARRSCLSRMERLHFRTISTPELSRVLDSPYLVALKELSFGHCRLDNEAAKLLGASPKMATLEILDFGRGYEGGINEVRNRIGKDGLAALANSPYLSRLRSLGLHGNAVGDAGVRVLLSAVSLEGLCALDVRSTCLSDAGVRQLVESPWVASLRTLRLGGDEILGDEAVESLVQSPHLTQLHELELSLTDDGAKIMASTACFTNLQKLHVNAGVTDWGMEVLRSRFNGQL